jgi:hypothetical protein
MKYIKLFEKFNGTNKKTLYLIESLNRYKELIEENAGRGDVRRYFDILSLISERMIYYKDILEHVLRMKFNSESDRLHTIVRDLHSLFLDLRSESVSVQSKGIIEEITEILYRYSHMVEKVIDIHNYYRSGDMNAMSSGMREESEMLNGIMQSHSRFERLWTELLMNFDSVDKFEKKKELLEAIMNLMIEIEDGNGIKNKFENSSKSILDILSYIIKALNTNLLGNGGGTGEINRMSEYYYELENSERLMIEMIRDISQYLLKDK